MHNAVLRFDLRCLLLLICFGLSACQPGTPVPAVAPPPAAPTSPPAAVPPTPRTVEIDHPRFRLFKTQNIWTLLLLDSRSGQLWQTQ